MYIIDVNIAENREVILSSHQGGNIYENNSTLLNFIIPEKYSDYYKYLDIDMGGKGKTQTVVSSVKETKFSYSLPENLTSYPTLYLQLVFKKGSEVFKSNLFNIVFNGSICATQVLENNFKDSIQTIMETKTDLDITKELADRKLEKTVFYDFQNSQDEINLLKTDKSEFDRLEEDFIRETEALGDRVGTNEKDIQELKENKANQDEINLLKTDKSEFDRLEEDFIRETEALGERVEVNEKDIQKLKEHKENLDYIDNKISEEINKTEEKSGLLYSNTLKRNESGEVIRIDDVSPVEHTAKVKMYGKNLVNIDKMTYVGGSCNFVNNGDGSYTLIKNDSKRFTRIYYFVHPIPANTTITISFSIIENTTSNNLQVTLSGHKAFAATGDKVKVITTTKDVESLQLYLMHTEEDGVYITIKDFQIELGDTKTSYTPYVENITDVKLIKHRRNLITLDSDTRFTKQEDGSYINNTKLDGSTLVSFYIPAGTYTISYELKSNVGDNVRLSWCDINSTEEYNQYKASTGEYIQFEKTYTFTKPIVGYKITYSGAQPNVNTVYIKNLQIEDGNTKTDLDEFSTEEYSVNPDGSVDGVIMNYPTTTLFADTEGVTINAEYNQDANKTIEKLTNAIIALGGNI